MSLTVKHLNGDSTFLLIFSPVARPTPSDLLAANGAFSVLVDPWITGSSIVNAPWFAITHRVVPSSITHISQIEEPDVVLVSQNKPDHCHKETLLQLDPHGKTVIAAEPGAAKAIKTWNHFDPNRVHGLMKYDAKARFGNSLRLRIPPLGPDGLPGELNIAFIPAKIYMTGLHNAFGITYQPPTAHKAPAPVKTIDLPKTHYFHLPRTAGFGRTAASSTSPTSALGNLGTISTDSRANSSVMSSPPQLSPDCQSRPSPVEYHTPELLSFADRLSIRLSEDGVLPLDPNAVQETSASPLNLLANFDFSDTLPTPPESPGVGSIRSSYHAQTTSNHDSQSSNSSVSLPTSPEFRYSRAPTMHPARPKAISALYTPHGIALQDLKSYIQNHLVPLRGALPLTLLLHSFDFTQNPWFLGGNIMAGAAGGIQIAKALMARTWLSAHDEAKDDRGVAVKLLKTRRTQAEEIRRQMLQGPEAKTGWVCNVRNLDVGKEICLSTEDRDLCGAKEGLAVLGLTDSTGFPFRVETVA